MKILIILLTILYLPPVLSRKNNASYFISDSGEVYRFINEFRSTLSPFSEEAVNVRAFKLLKTHVPFFNYTFERGNECFVVPRRTIRHSGDNDYAMWFFRSSSQNSLEHFHDKPSFKAGGLIKEEEPILPPLPFKERVRKAANKDAELEAVPGDIYVIPGISDFGKCSALQKALYHRHPY